MSLYKPKGSPFWHYDFQYRGQRFHGSTRTTDRIDAQRIEDDEREAVRRDGVTVNPHRMTLDQAVGEYWQRHARHTKAAVDTEKKLERVVYGLGKNLFIADITNKDISDYSERRRAAVSNASVNREIVLLRAALFFCRDKLDALIPKINWKDHMLPEPRGRTRHLSAEEETRLLKTIRPDYRPLVEFCLLTGCRVSSARNLKWPDVSDTTVRLYVKSKTAGDWHDLPVTPDMREIFEAVRGHHPEYVFTYKCVRQGERKIGTRHPFTKSNWRRAWKAALEAAKIADFRFHDLRHTAGTRILKASQNVALAQRVLGHRDISSTLRYAHVMTEDVLKALTKSPEQKSRNKKENRLKSKRNKKV